jgi:hypothetical protein
MRRSAKLGLAAILCCSTAGQPQAADNPLAALADNATYELSAYGAYFPTGLSRSEADDDMADGWSRLMATTQADLSSNLSLKIKAFGVFPTTEGDHRGLFSLPRQQGTRAHYADFARLALVYDANVAMFTLGKSDLSAGVSTLYSPADRFETTYAANPMHAFKTGVWQARVDIPAGDDTLTAALLPFDNRSVSPGAHSRWLGSGSASSSYSFNSLDLGPGVELSEPFRNADPKNWGYLAKYKASRSGYDFFLLAHHGPAAFPVVYQPTLPNAQIMYPMAETLAGGVSFTVDHWEFHGETSYQNVRLNRDQDVGKYVIGASYRDSTLAGWLGWEEIQPLVEYASEYYTDMSVNKRTLTNSSSARPFRDAVLARLEARINDNWKWTVGGSLNLVDRDSTLRAGIEYKHNDNLTWRLDAQHFEGHESTQFGRWRKNDFIELGFEWKF